MKNSPLCFKRYEDILTFLESAIFFLSVNKIDLKANNILLYIK